MASWFLLYGTLLDRDRNPVAAALHARLEPGKAATVPGRLYAIPDAATDADAWYPALIPGEPGSVRGRLHAASPAFTPADLAQLDRYEDFTPEDAVRSEYVRRLLPVTLTQTGDSPDPANRAAVFAFVYCYNRPLPAAAVAIPGGDFGAWRRETGARAYGSTA